MSRPRWLSFVILFGIYFLVFLLLKPTTLHFWPQLSMSRTSSGFGAAVREQLPIAFVTALTMAALTIFVDRRKQA